MCKYLIAAAGAALLVPTAALAQAQPENFYGPYAGAEAGMTKRSIDRSIGDIGLDDSLWSFDFGLFGGYDWRVGDRVVASAEGHLGGGGDTLRDSFAGIATTADPQWNYSLSGRLGYLANDTVLFYGRLGYGGERVRITVIDPADTLSERGSEWFNGLVTGGGVEFAMSPSMRVRGEFRYKDFDGSYNPKQLLVGASWQF